jgi:hypothetical protein
LNPTNDVGNQRIRDEEHLQLLGLFYYISGGLSALFGLFPLMYVAFGVMIALMPEAQDPEAEAVAGVVGIVFAAIGMIAFLFAQAFAAIKFFAGYSIRHRKRRIACLAVAAVCCLGLPYSTILGVFTFVVLLRDSVRDLFEKPSISSAANGDGAA